jgi:hypothetical protein
MVMLKQHWLIWNQQQQLKHEMIYEILQKWTHKSLIFL